MAYTDDRTYDQIVSGPRAVLPLHACSFAGTQTALAVGGTALKVPFACKLVAASWLPVSGATVAVATSALLINKSTAGTTAWATIGTFDMADGTQAAAGTTDGGTASLSATESTVTLAKGDVLSVQHKIATVAVIGTNDYWFVVQELPS